MIETWLIVQMIKIALGVFLGAILLWWAVWKYLDFENGGKSNQHQLSSVQEGNQTQREVRTPKRAYAKTNILR